ncbi:CDP-diacylglycerol---serine O-phosphatidyltransferase [Alphaproteobacteria bacterium]
MRVFRKKRRGFRYNTKENHDNQVVPLYKLFPNIITILVLCIGITAIRYALDGKFNIAAGLIVIASFMDGLDGRIARLLKSTSEFGAYLDSFADIASFGIAPGIVTYLWALHNIPYKGIGWGVILIYISCAALRLARFNVQNIGSGSLSQNKNKKQGYDETQDQELINTVKGSPGSFYLGSFFSGIPMPAAAVLCITPLMLTFDMLSGYTLPTLFIAMYVLVVGFLMVSRIPTFAAKHMKIKRIYVPLLLFGSAIFVVSMLLEPWIVMPLVAFGYIISLPFCFFYVRKNG